ncbi:hypothetical protein DL98DRAFT_534486 [Cadophora sp. DSE1049]|nr:hypothetical protein DL98DRAFT_534486 [Cadophora sp. DSE1049]
MSDQSGLDDEERRKREYQYRVDRLNKERHDTIGVLYGIHRSPEEEDWAKQQESPSSSGKQPSQNSPNYVQPAAPSISHRTWFGYFESEKEVEFTWKGHNGRKGTAWAYVASIDGPIQVGLALGTAFSFDNPNAFGSQALTEPALLNVQSQMKEVEQSQIQTNETSADAQAAELARKRQAQNESKQKQKQKQKQSGSSSSSKNSRSYKKK